MGEMGAVYCAPEGTLHIKPFPCNPIDTTGAGDAFNGALAGTLNQGYSIYDSLIQASAFAACTTECSGISLPDYEEVKLRIEKIRY